MTYVAKTVQRTLKKRLEGLFKKASQLETLTGARVFLTVVSEDRKKLHNSCHRSPTSVDDLLSTVKIIKTWENEKWTISGNAEHSQNAC